MARLRLTLLAVALVIPLLGEDAQLERLVTLADIWGKLYLFHPRVVSDDLSFERTLVETLPRVERAASTGAFVAALNESLFQPLDDPLLYAQTRFTGAPASPKKLNSRKLSATVGYIDATDADQFRDSTYLSQFLHQLQGLGEIKALVVDLRFPYRPIALNDPRYAPMDWIAAFADAPETSTQFLSRAHRGWNEDDFSTFDSGSNVYEHFWKIGKNWVFRRPSAKPGQVHIPTAFLVNHTAYDFASARLDNLQGTGRSVVLYERQGNFVQSVTRYPGDLEVNLNTQLLLSRSGNAGVQPDYVTSGRIGDDELPALAERLLEARAQQRLRPTHPYSPELRFPRAEGTTGRPISREERLLGLFKLWTVVRYLDPHVEYASVDWATALRDWIPRVIAADTSRDYYVVLRQIAATLNDSHVVVDHPSLRLETPAAMGTHGIPGRMRMIDKKHIVMEAFPYRDGTRAPLSPGDEVLSINGRRVEDIDTEFRSHISGSTVGALERELEKYISITTGEGAADIVVRDVNGTRTVHLPGLPVDRRPNRPAWRESVEGIGYLDLAILTEDKMEQALTAMEHTRGLVVDLRGGLQGSLLSRLIDKPVWGQHYEIPIVWEPGQITRSSIESDIWVQPHPGKRYSKPVVVLIDERTQSSAESFCMALHHANRATLVGSRTAGTIGNTTRLSLPDGGRMTFTGERLTYADRSRFQNIGVIPDVTVEPTIRGVREGRDEVMEKGVEALKRILQF